MSDKNLRGKIVAILAKDHSSSINIDKDDLDRIKAGTATIVVIGLVIHDDDEKIMLGSFFTDFQGEQRHYEVHTILKSAITDIDVLKTLSI